MKVTIIPDDQSVGVDGDFISPLDLSALDPSIHAVQWYGAYGEVEYKTTLVDGRPVKPENRFFTVFEPFQFAVDLWNAEDLVRKQNATMPVTITPASGVIPVVGE